MFSSLYVDLGSFPDCKKKKIEVYYVYAKIMKEHCYVFGEFVTNI